MRASIIPITIEITWFETLSNAFHIIAFRVVFSRSSIIFPYVYFTSEPGRTSSAGSITINRPSASSAERIIPCDSIPLSFLGAKLAIKHTFLPTKSSGA